MKKGLKSESKLKLTEFLNGPETIHNDDRYIGNYQYRGMIDEIDGNKDYQISFEEFKNAIL